MSVTFSLPSNETLWPSCPACGGRGNGSPDPDEDCEEPECLGYGPDRIDSTPSLNVANGNAYVLLRDLLGYQNPELYGELPPADLSIRLAMASGRIKAAVRETVQEGNVISCGLTFEQVAHYLLTLAKMANLACRRDETIRYG